MIRRVGVILGLLASYAGSVQAQESAPLDCLLEPNRVVDVSSAVRGVLSAVEVDRGDLVEQDQIVARLDSRVEQAAMELAQARARASAEVQADKLNAEFAARRSERLGALFDKRAISGDQFDESDTIARMRELEHQQAREKQHLAQLEARQTEEILKRHTVRSPVRGVVIQRYLSPGESAEDRPILRIAEIQTLRAEAIIPVALLGTVKVGQQAVIVPEAPLTGHYVGTVSVVDRVADAASGTFRARVSLANPDSALPSGLRCAVRFLQPGESVAENIPVPPASRPLSRVAPSASRPRTVAMAPSASEPH
jgi:RND family efflux transporter MFP subunit